MSSMDGSYEDIAQEIRIYANEKRGQVQITPPEGSRIIQIEEEASAKEAMEYESVSDDDEELDNLINQF